MSEKKKLFTWSIIILIFLAPFLIRGAIGLFGGLSGGSNIEKVRTKIEDYLYQEYGEEFVVDRIGTRRSRGDKFYQARIYPRSIIGTPKEHDGYYYASASVDKLAFGRLGGVGDSYCLLNRNIDVENYLLPETKKIFGERVLLKVDVEHKVTGDGSWWAGYKSSSLEEMRKDLEEEPDRTRIELELYVYIFDRIDNEAEKEERRQQIFDYVQYLKREGFFKYLSLVIKIVDERVLAPSYRTYKRKLDYGGKENVNIDGIQVKMPPNNIIEEMFEVLDNELAKQNEREITKNINNINKNEIGVEGLEGYLLQYFLRIISIDMMKIQPYGEYEEEKERGNLNQHNYLKIEDINLGNEYIKYIFKKQGGTDNE